MKSGTRDHCEKVPRDRAAHSMKSRKEPTEDAGYRMRRTEQEPSWTSFVEILPSRNRATDPVPLAPVTMRSAFLLAATFRISSTGFPDRTMDRTT